MLLGLIDGLKKNAEFYILNNTGQMVLIKSISGIRGTIGGKAGEALTPVDIVAFSSAFGHFIKSGQRPGNSGKFSIAVGRDARTSGVVVQSLVVNTLLMMGIDVIDLGLATTPTVEMAVTGLGADGGIILTASHNPGNWNALKLINSGGEFLSAGDGEELLNIIAGRSYEYSDVGDIGRISSADYLDEHINSILELPVVNKEAIAKSGFSIAVDAVNSVGGIAIPKLLESLGVRKIECINCEANGIFAHNPEPLAENLTEISNLIKKGGCDLGIVVDPDVDRLALICEDGSMFGEEYTLVAVADFILSKGNGAVVSNMSSSRALWDVANKHGCKYYSSAVGEVNVVEKMKETDAVIGGEGNGGVIFPELHYGRDALVGIALIMSYIAEKNIRISQLKKELPEYFMSKNKVVLKELGQADLVLDKLIEKHANSKPDLRDGIKIELPDSWVHLRKSNTEPILRIFTEAPTQAEADKLAGKFIEEINQLMQLL